MIDLLPHFADVFSYFVVLSLVLKGSVHRYGMIEPEAEGYRVCLLALLFASPERLVLFARWEIMEEECASVI
jgi:hypothetical protein